MATETETKPAKTETNAVKAEKSIQIKKHREYLAVVIVGAIDETILPHEVAKELQQLSRDYLKSAIKLLCSETADCKIASKNSMVAKTVFQLQSAFKDLR